MAHYLAGAVGDDRDPCTARYELFLEVARRPHLCPALDAWERRAAPGVRGRAGRCGGRRPRR
ncbi:hypothetical protein ACGF8B_25445 [Streptomyces sp. NPDC047917]|uniref:hypothetical protein n=1 Tax=Streptomyces sp. NPDC047917 TaxID=3365491 RepID=UPI00371A940B